MNNAHSTHHRGYGYALLSALLFGASAPAAKYLLNTTNPWFLAGLLYFGAGIGLFITLVVRHCWHQTSEREANLSSNDYRWLAIATLFGGILGPVLMMFGLSEIEASSASLLLNFESVFTSVIAWKIFKEHTDKRLVIGMIFIVAGGIILASEKYQSVHSIVGSFFMIAACLAWSIDNNVTRNISAADPVKIVAIKSFFAGCTNIILALTFEHVVSIQWSMISIATIIGFIGYGLSIIFFILGLRHIGTARTSAYFSIAPFIGAGLSLLFLHEPLSVLFVIAGIFMLIGVGLHLTEYHAHQHEHEPITHTHKHYHDEHHQHTHTNIEKTDGSHSHHHTHEILIHSHPHYPDIHHRHEH